MQRMGRVFGIKFDLIIIVALSMGIFMGRVWAQGNVADEDTDGAVYIVTLKQAPTSHIHPLFSGELRLKKHHAHFNISHGSASRKANRFDKPRYYYFVLFFSFSIFLITE